MNQRSFVNIISAIVVIIFFAGAGYFMFVKKSEPITQQMVTPTPTIEYRNVEYGFSFTLPTSWKNYSIVTGKWEGYTFEDLQGDTITERGPIISIRHPEWTSENPRQDIPIMIFTTDQWNSLQHDKFHIGAAPINPSELAQNSKYVFALPARYNFAFPTGYEEVEKILQDKPIQAF